MTMLTGINKFRNEHKGLLVDSTQMVQIHRLLIQDFRMQWAIICITYRAD